MSTPQTPRLLILIGGHLATAPRPQKEAACALAHGFEVTIMGHWWNDALAQEDMSLANMIGVKFIAITDRCPSQPGSFALKLRQKLTKILFKHFGRFSPRLLGTGVPEQLQAAIKLRADLTVVHSEGGLWIAKKLLEQGFRVAVDFEDWFSEDVAPEDRVGRPVAVIKQLEHHLLRSAHATWTTTKVMAEAMATDTGTSRIPSVIPNCFPFSAAPRPDDLPKDARSADAVSLYWFSQTIGPHRGLEMLAEALVQLTGKWELHLRGDLRHYQAWFENTFPPALRERITVHPTAPNVDLARLSSSHDIGLALEIPAVPSRDLTATNKLFEYMRCGLAVIATTTQGQVEIMQQCADAGWLVPPRDAGALAQILQYCINHRDQLAKAKQAATRAASERWDWEPFSKQLAVILDEASPA